MSILDPTREEIDQARRSIDEWYASNPGNVHAYVLGRVESDLKAAAEAAETDELDGGARRDVFVRRARASIAGLAEWGAR